MMSKTFVTDLFTPDKDSEDQIESESKIAKERYSILMFIFFGLMVFFYLIELNGWILIICLILTQIFYLLWRLPKWKKKPKVNSKPITLKISETRITIGDKTIEKDHFLRIRIDLKSYEGQTSKSSHPDYMYVNGTNNQIRYYFGGAEYISNFCLFNYPHYLKLIRILKKTNIQFSDEVAWI